MIQKRDERFKIMFKIGAFWTGQSPLPLPQESPEPSRDLLAAHTIRSCVPPTNRLVYTARRSEMPGSFWVSAEASAKTIHAHIRPVGSVGSAEVTTWCAIDIYDWAKPTRSPIFDVSRENSKSILRRV